MRNTLLCCLLIRLRIRRMWHINTWKNFAAIWQECPKVFLSYIGSSSKEILSAFLSRKKMKKAFDSLLPEKLRNSDKDKIIWKEWHFVDFFANLPYHLTTFLLHISLCKWTTLRLIGGIITVLRKNLGSFCCIFEQNPIYLHRKQENIRKTTRLILGDFYKLSFRKFSGISCEYCRQCDRLINSKIPRKN